MDDILKLMQVFLSPFSYPLSQNCGQLSSLVNFQLHVSIHSWHLSVRQVLNSWEAHQGLGKKKSIPKGSCSLLKSISNHLNTTPHCDDIDSLQDMYLQCLAMSDFLVNLKRKKERKKGKQERKERVPIPSEAFLLVANYLDST